MGVAGTPQQPSHLFAGLPLVTRVATSSSHVYDNGGEIPLLELSLLR